MTSVRRAGFAAALAAAPFALAWRFALVYRVRAGYPKPRPLAVTPEGLGLAFEETTVEAPGASLPAWFIPARDGAPGPGVVLVHGWESGRDRTLPLALILHAVGFHVLTFDVRGHGANQPEALPVSGGEFGSDARAAFQALLARPEVTHGAIHGHSMGGIGAILAAAADPRVVALAATSSPADPYRLTRQTFRLARLPLPDLVAYPLAWWTTRVYLEPRGHAVEEIDASRAIARYRGPILLTHGDADQVVPFSHMKRLEQAARAARARRSAGPEGSAASPVESCVIPGGGHSWLYEYPAYRAALARFLATALGGPMAPDEAAVVAAAVPAMRLADPQVPFTAVAAEPGGFRSLAAIASRRAAGALAPSVHDAPGWQPSHGLPDAEPPVPEEPFDPLTGPTTLGEGAAP
ncbi:MAG TPA: alpha/beta fold hydrolase [Vitreimonas sp.]|nr:alpha/beta fold hydrolase [Vitreimonas sp.]